MGVVLLGVTDPALSELAIVFCLLAMFIDLLPSYFDLSVHELLLLVRANDSSFGEAGCTGLDCFELLGQIALIAILFEKHVDGLFCKM